MNDFLDDHTQPCLACHGTGRDHDGEECLDCEGFGWVDNCPSCDGTGTHPDDTPCCTCGGTGIDNWEPAHWCASCGTGLDLLDTNDEICRHCLDDLDIDPTPVPYNTGPPVDPDPTPGALARALAADWADNPDPVRQLRSARQLQHLLHRYRWHRILRARMNSASWAQIADALGDSELGALVDYLADTAHFPHDPRTFHGHHLWWALDEPDPTNHQARTHQIGRTEAEVTR